MESAYRNSKYIRKGENNVHNWKMGTWYTRGFKGKDFEQIGSLKEAEYKGVAESKMKGNRTQ